MILSSLAFFLLNTLPQFKQERVDCQHRKSSFPTEFEEIKTNSSASKSSEEPQEKETQSYYLLLTLICTLCFFCNGFLPSIQTYSCLPYGNLVYHFTVTLYSMANPCVAFAANFLPTRKLLTLYILSGIGFIFVGFIFATALYSPEPLWGIQLGGTFTVIFTPLFNLIVIY